jgi:threonine/homoserine/homoserine lactone efflux protein
MTGFLLNFTNPLAIIYWLGFYGLVSTTPAYNSGPINMLLNILTVLTGALIWGSILAVAAHFGKKLVNDKILGYVSLIAGSVLIGFGILLGYKTFVMI